MSYPELSFCKDMATDFLSHPGSGRVRDGHAPDNERELKSLKVFDLARPGPGLRRADPIEANWKLRLLRIAEVDRTISENAG